MKLDLSVIQSADVVSESGVTAVLALRTPLPSMRPTQALILLAEIERAGARVAFQGTDFVIIERRGP